MTFLDWQMPSWGVWEVGKTKISCKEAGSVQYKAHHTWAPPHIPQQINCVSQTVINWDVKICNKLQWCSLTFWALAQSDEWIRTLWDF